MENVIEFVMLDSAWSVQRSKIQNSESEGRTADLISPKKSKQAFEDVIYQCRLI